jgi:hypothetical protein
MSKMSIRNGRNAFDCPETRRPRRHFPHRRHFSPVPPEGVSYYQLKPRVVVDGLSMGPNERPEVEIIDNPFIHYQQNTNNGCYLNKIAHVVFGSVLYLVLKNPCIENIENIENVLSHVINES